LWVFRSAGLSSRDPAAPTPATRSHNQQVVEHGLRHLAGLVKDDATVRSLLSEEWKRVLADDIPEPFRHMG
jgi:hypothetical protein